MASDGFQENENKLITFKTGNSWYSMVILTNGIENMFVVKLLVSYEEPAISQVLCKKVLLKIPQYSEENISAEASF